MKESIAAPSFFSTGFVALILMASGCTPQLKQSEIKFLETRELDLPYDEAYEAAANGMFSLGFAISHSDKESGIISGSSHDPRTGQKVANTILFGVIGLALTEGVDYAISFKLTERGSEVTQLRMKLIKNGKQIIDRKLMTNIWQSIEREAMLDTRPPSPGQQKIQEGKDEKSPTVVHDPKQTAT